MEFLRKNGGTACSTSIEMYRFYVFHVKNYEKLPPKLFSRKIRGKEKFSNFHIEKGALSRFIFTEMKLFTNLRVKL